MSAADVPVDGSQVASERPRAVALTRAAYVVNLSYLLWFWVTFAAGYWVYSWFDLEPGATALTDEGIRGWIALTAWALSASVPSWLGTRFAIRALRAGGLKSAVGALILNLVFIVGFSVLILLSG